MAQLKPHPDPDTLDAVANCIYEESMDLGCNGDPLSTKMSDSLERVAERLHRKASEERHG